MTWNDAGPKFWDDQEQEVVDGVEIRKTPTPLADILGTYVWVYSGDHEFPGDVKEEYYSTCKDDKDFTTRHGITLSNVVKDDDPSSSDPSQEEVVAPENVKGHVAWGTFKVAFNGVRRVRKGMSSDETVPFMESNWEVLLIESEDCEDEESNYWLDMEGNTVGASVVLDDNGSPFLVFDWSHPYGCHGSWSGYYVGRRMEDGKRWEMTDEERDRLGIGRTSKSVAKSAKVKKGRSSGRANDRNKSPQPQRSDNGDGDKNGGKDAVSKGVQGEKRKATCGETSTSKRRRA